MKIAVFYHIKPGPPIDPVNAVNMFSEQMRTFRESGLEAAADHICIGMNGTPEDYKRILPSLPNCCETLQHGQNARSELPTMYYMQEWFASHPDWYVCYWHAKGVSHPPDRLHRAWRRCMERAVIEKWRTCVRDLDMGYESAGAHWLTPEQYPGVVKAPFWGGNFWWAKASFLLTLPKLRKNSEAREQDFDAESWIGWGPVRPKVIDYAPHWPDACQRLSNCFFVKT